MVTIGPVNKTSPTVQFWMDAVVYDQSVAGNWSRVQINVRAYNTGTSSSNYGGAGQHIGSIDGVGVVVNHAATPFLPSVAAGALRWNDAGVSGPIYHDANGNLGITVRMQIAYGSINEQYTAVLYLPSIPKPPSKPITPTLISVGTTTIDYNFFNSPSNGGSVETGWDHQSATDAAFTQNLQQWVDYGSPAQATALIPGTQTWIRYRSVNAYGASPWSDPLVQTTLPAVPPGLTVLASPSGTQALLTFTPPGGVTGVTKYDWERRVAGTTTPVVTGSTPVTETVITDLTPGTRYEWRGSAWIGSYQSPWGNWLAVTQPKPNTNPGDYFDGSTPDSPDLDYAWTGTANNSTSTATGLMPTGWSAEMAGGSAIIARVLAGYVGAYAARVTIITDATAAGCRLGQAPITPYWAGVTGKATYFGQMRVNLSRLQRIALEITWLNAAGAVVSRTVGTPASVPANVWTMMSANGVAPDTAEHAAVRIVDVTGTDWALWHGGDTITLDAAMLSLNEYFPYFDGDTIDDGQFIYAWSAASNASPSTKTPVALSINTQSSPSLPSRLALIDPDCEPVPAPPRPPTVPSDCIDDTGVWRRYYVTIDSVNISDWLSVVPTLEVTTGARPARQVRIRYYPNPEDHSVDQIDVNTWCAEQIISYMPASTSLTLDGVTQRVWAEVGGGDAQNADHLLYGTGGKPATWPVLSCGMSYVVSLEVPVDAPEGNIQTKAYVTTRT